MSGTNSSATGGYLTPSTTLAAPPEDDALLDVFQAVIVGASGIPAPLVRPRWQPLPPTQPAFTVDWCAFGITRRAADATAYIAHDPVGPTGQGQDLLQRHESIDVLCTFYGPDSAGNAAALRDDLQVGQNREGLWAVNAGLIDVGEIIAAPELTNEQWVSRSDMTVRIRRQVQRAYPILNILSSQGTIEAAGTIGSIGVADVWSTP